jgi:probable addiction module antidote protein
LAATNKGTVVKVVVKVVDLPKFDPATLLDSEEAIVTFLNAIIEADDSTLLVSALGDVVRARGMASVATATGPAGDALHQALRSEPRLRFDTVSHVCHALGLKIVVQIAA